MENKNSQITIFSGNGQDNVGCSKKTPSTDLDSESLLTKL